MVFFTIILLIIELIILVVGKPFKQLMIDSGEEEIENAKLGIEEFNPSNDLLVRQLVAALFAFTMLILDLVYLTIAINIDPFLYPTLALLALYIFKIIKSVIASKKGKPDLTDEYEIGKYREKLRSGRKFSDTLIVLIWIAYYIYMLYFLIV